MSVGPREAGRGRRRAAVPGRSHRRDDHGRRACPPGNRRSRPGRRNIAAQRRARAGHLLPQLRRRRSASGRDGSASGRRPPSPPRSAAAPGVAAAPRSPLGVPHVEVDHAGPAVAREDRRRGHGLAAVAVVERDARRVRGQRCGRCRQCSTTSWSVTPWKPWRASQPIWPREAVRRRRRAPGRELRPAGRRSTWYMRIGIGSDVGWPVAGCGGRRLRCRPSSGGVGAVVAAALPSPEPPCRRARPRRRTPATVAPTAAAMAKRRIGRS